MTIDIGGKMIKVHFQRKKIKRTYIRITSNKEILITSSNKMNDADIVSIINLNYEWIVKKLRTIKVIELNPNEYILFGKVYKLNIINSEDFSITDKFINAKNLDLIEGYAIKVIEKRFDKIIENIGLNFIPILKFRRMKSKWGVCHIQAKKIVLNKILIHTPFELIDYIIFHEIAHFKVPNHSKNFYIELSKFCPNHKFLKTQLKEYSSLL